MSPSFIEEDDRLVLMCANCRNDCIHQGQVDIYNRGDADPEGCHVRAAGKTVTVDRDLAGNPSLWQQGLAIRFVCEACHLHSTLTIAQHKGRTYVEMRKSPTVELGAAFVSTTRVNDPRAGS